MKYNKKMNTKHKICPDLKCTLTNDPDYYQRLYYRGICIKFSPGDEFPLENNIYDLYGIYHFLSRTGNTGLWELYKPTEIDSLEVLQSKVDTILNKLHLHRAIFNKNINDKLMYDTCFDEMVCEFDFGKKYKSIQQYLFDLKEALEPKLPKSSLRLNYKVQSIDNSAHKVDMISISYKSTLLFTIFFIDLEYYDSECDYKPDNINSAKILNQVLLNL